MRYLMPWCVYALSLASLLALTPAQATGLYAVHELGAARRTAGHGRGSL
jgi:hypothetical protein